MFNWHGQDKVYQSSGTKQLCCFSSFAIAFEPAAHSFYTAVLFSPLHKHFLLITSFASHHAQLCQLFPWRNILLKLAIYFCRPSWCLCKLRSTFYLRPKVCPFELRTEGDADITCKLKIINKYYTFPSDIKSQKCSCNF